MTIWVWITLLVFLFTLWVAVARELQNALLSYLLQTGLVAVLYGMDATRSHDTGMWIAFAGLLVIRGGIVPSLVWARLPRADVRRRANRFVVTPTFVVISVILVALLTGATVQGWHVPHALSFGLALATLLTGIVVTSLTHDGGRQMVGLLCAENGVDVAIATILADVSMMADYVIFIDIALAALLFVILIRHQGSFNVQDFNQLRG